MPNLSDWGGDLGKGSIESHNRASVEKSVDPPASKQESPRKPPPMRRLRLLARSSPKKAIQRPSFGPTSRLSNPPVVSTAPPHRSPVSVRSSWIDLADEVHFDGSTAANGKDKASSGSQAWYRGWRPSSKGAPREARATLVRPPPSSYRAVVPTAPSAAYCLREPPPLPVSILRKEPVDKPQPAHPVVPASQYEGEEGKNGISTSRKPPPARPLLLPTMQTQPGRPTFDSRTQAYTAIPTTNTVQLGRSESMRRARRSEVSSIATVRQEDVSRPSPKRTRTATAQPTLTSPLRSPPGRPIAPLPPPPSARRMGDSLPIPPRAGSQRARARASTVSSASSMDPFPRELDAEPTATSIGTSILFADVEMALSRLAVGDAPPRSDARLRGSKNLTGTPSRLSPAAAMTPQPSADEIQLAAVLARMLCSQTRRSAGPKRSASPSGGIRKLLESVNAADGSHDSQMDTSEATEILSELVARFRNSPMPTPSRSTSRRSGSATLRTPERRARRPTPGSAAPGSRGSLTPEQWRREESQRFSDVTFANSILSYASTPLSSSTEDLTSLIDGMMEASEGEASLSTADTTPGIHIYDGPATHHRLPPSSSRKRKESGSSANYFLSRAERDQAMSPIPEGGIKSPIQMRGTPHSAASGREAVCAILDLYQQQREAGPSPTYSSSRAGSTLRQHNVGSARVPRGSLSPSTRSPHSVRYSRRGQAASIRSGSRGSIRRATDVQSRVRNLDLTRAATRARQDSMASSTRPSTEPDDTFSITAPMSAGKAAHSRQQPYAQHDVLVYRVETEATADEEALFRELQHKPQRRLFQPPAPLTPPVSAKEGTASKPWMSGKYACSVTLTPPDSSDRITADLPPLKASALHHHSRTLHNTHGDTMLSPNGGLFNLPSLVITDADVEAKCRSLSTTPAREEKGKDAPAARSAATPSAVPQADSPFRAQSSNLTRAGTSASASTSKSHLAYRDETCPTPRVDSDDESSSSSSSSPSSSSDSEEEDGDDDEVIAGSCDTHSGGHFKYEIGRGRRASVRQTTTMELGRVSFSLMSPLREGEGPPRWSAQRRVREEGGEGGADGVKGKGDGMTGK